MVIKISTSKTTKMETVILIAVLVGIIVSSYSVYSMSTIMSDVSTLIDRVTEIEEAIRPAGIPYGGTAILYLKYDVDTLNPFASTGGAAWWFNHQCWMASTLVKDSLNFTGPEPWLAQSWEVSADGLTYTFHLIQNATWHDGEPFTSNDAKFTFDYAEEKAIPRWLPTIALIEKVEAPDQYTFIIRLKERSIGFLAFFRELKLVPEHIWKNVEDPMTYEYSEAIGIGPFKFVRWIRGQYLEYAKYENFWMKGLPYLDKVIWRVISTYDARLMAFEKGEIDGLVSISSADVPRLLAMPNVKLYQGLSKGWQFAAPNMRRKPLDDLQFRIALAHSVDREMIVDLAYGGYAHTWDHFLPEPYGMAGWVNEDVKWPEFNLTKAAEVLDNAGYIDLDADGWREQPDGSKLTLKLIAAAGRIGDWKMAEIMAETWNKVGLNIQPEGLETGTLVTRMMTYDFDIGVMSWGTGFDPDTRIWGCHSSQDQPYLHNFPGFRNTTYDQLAEQQRITSDPEERQTLIHQCEAIIADQVAFFPGPQRVSLSCVRTDKFEGFQKSVTGGVFTSNILPDCWLYVHLKS